MTGLGRSARSQGRTRRQEIGSLESLLRDPGLSRDDRIRYSARLAELRGDTAAAASLRALTTCRCGMWPVDEYGPECPSCHHIKEDNV